MVQVFQWTSKSTWVAKSHAAHWLGTKNVMSPILYPTNHAGHTRQQNVGVIFTRSADVHIKIVKKFQNGCFGAIWRRFQRSDSYWHRRTQQDSSDEESLKRDKAIESAVNCFTECSDLQGEIFALVEQGEKRYLRGL